MGTVVKERAELGSKDGSAVAIRPGTEGEILETGDRRGRLVFEYEPGAGRAVLHLGPGVRLEARGGRAELVCERGLSIRSGGALELEGAAGVRVNSPGGPLEVRAGEAKVSVGKLDAAIGRVVGWAKEVYQRVEGLWHLRSGRTRVQASGDFLVQSDRARVQASGDVHLQGRTVNLG
jgi:hypothetical protein